MLWCHDATGHLTILRSSGFRVDFANRDTLFCHTIIYLSFIWNLLLDKKYSRHRDLLQTAATSNFEICTICGGSSSGGKSVEDTAQLYNRSERAEHTDIP